ncbi:ABC transporter transmembrane domain-containing protein [Rhizobium glycinendophyticum]|uniref:ABC transporter ATP-binding protein n=1 Tax=Rhizobium glycinendophyticum TaxID=2589807 RepID=A0A504UVT0_9HYPH|nr:ABC transporter transmembrane domain-containing protein [Rhizobium glycinendophyticum]TPP09312.1 ABC transporter ATP-binding protein [Rhizobium glycinendophyticum]
MEKSLPRYIWKHTWRQQVVILVIVALSMIPYFFSLDLPKQIINGPIQGDGFAAPDAVQPFFEVGFDMPLVGRVELYAGYPLNRLSMLMALSLEFLALVIINNGFKYVINTYKGRLGERLLRRIRFQLIDRVLRFPPNYFKRTKSSEVATMIKDEVEPLGGYAGDAFVAPAMLGGQIVAALGFILAQSLWLGMIAVFMAMLQLGIIPRMRRRLIRLGRERQLTARRLAGRVGEMVEGISTIHAYDTSNYERADMAHRLGEIFAIRYDLYQWKFMVKFINNFLAQVTPFLFYSIGGYLTLKGTLDVGQLVAVINAYKDLPGPLKDLIDWDQGRQDVQVKFEQVVEQFQSDAILPEEVQAVYEGHPPALPGTIAITNLAVHDDSGGRLVHDVSLELGAGEVVAFLDVNGTAAVAVAEALGRAVRPAAGRISVGDTNLLDLPESVSGRRISYVSAETYFFHGSLRDNLLYGLKHAPLRPFERGGKAATVRRWEIKEARLAGNVDFDIHGEWIGGTSNAVADRETQNAWMLEALDTVLLTDDVFDLGLRSVIDPQWNEKLARFAVEARQTLRDRLDELKLPQLVEPFDFDSYNSEATIAENLLFGTVIGGDDAARRIVSSGYFRSVLIENGLSEQLFDAGRKIVSTMVELFGEDQQSNSLMPELPFMEGREIPDLSRVSKEVEGKRLDQTNEELRRILFLTAFAYVESRYRFGILNDEIRAKIVKARHAFYANLPRELQSLIARFNRDEYQSSATLLDNIVFGKISRTYADSHERIKSQLVTLAKEHGAYPDVLEAGLSFDLGPGGKRLTMLQRQKLNVARAVIRHADYCILNQPLPGLNPRLQAQLVQNVISFLRKNTDGCTIVWVLSNPTLCSYFERVVIFDNGDVIANGSYEEIIDEDSVVKELIAR